MQSQPLLVDEIRTELEASVVDFADMLPSLIAAAVIVLIGFYLGSRAQSVAKRTGERLELDEQVRDTPFGTLFPDEPGAISSGVAALAKYYVVLIAAFVAVEWAAIPFVPGLVERAVLYVPWFVAGTAILVGGLLVADYLTEAARQSAAAQQSGHPAVVASATRAFLYFTVAVIGLDTMGVNVAILYTFGQAFAYAVTLATALAIGIAVGWGGKEYVAENLDDWLGGSGAPGDESRTVAGDD